MEKILPKFNTRDAKLKEAKLLSKKLANLSFATASASIENKEGDQDK